MAENERNSNVIKTESEEGQTGEVCLSPRGVVRGLARSAEVLDALEVQLPERLQKAMGAMEAKLTEGFSWKPGRLAELRERLLGETEQPSDDLKEGFNQLMVSSRGSNLTQPSRELLGMLASPVTIDNESKYHTVADIQAHLAEQNPEHADDELHATRRLVTVLTQLGTSYA